MAKCEVDVSLAALPSLGGVLAFVTLLSDGDLQVGEHRARDKREY